MTVVVSRKCNKNNKIYHQCGCIYERRIKPENRKGLKVEDAERRNYHACKYCSGLRGVVNLHKKELTEWTKNKNMSLKYHMKSNTLYMNTDVGFWKVFARAGSERYVLYHRNTYTAGMNFEEARRGDFHRQSDVDETKSLAKIMEYIVAHDRAKVTIMDDYRRLPQSTQKQRHYYKVAERRAKRNARKRVDLLFAALEQSNAGMKRYSIC